VRYEAKIGWRYLYGGKQDRLMMTFAGGSLAVAAAGLVTLIVAQGNPAGVLMFVSV